MAIRFDSSRLAKGKRTPQGYYRFDARLTRTGILEYTRPDGTIQRELRRPEEVFKAASLASLEGAPITVRHPRVPGGLLDASTTKAARVGGVMAPRADGRFVAATVQVEDAATIAAIERGELLELSCGYSCREDHTPGVWQGQPYDLEQKDIVNNHSALLPPGGGRSGADVALRFDSADAPLPDVSVTHFDATETASDTPVNNPISAPEKTVLVGKIELKLDAKDEAVISAHLAEQDAKFAKLEAQVAAAAKEKSELQARFDAATSPAAVQAAVSARVALETVAHTVLGAGDYSAKTDSEIRSAVVAKALPSLKLDGKDEATVRAYFDVAAALPAPEAEKTKEKSAESLRRAAEGTRTDGKDENDPAKAREERIKRNRERGTEQLK